MINTDQINDYIRNIHLCVNNNDSWGLGAIFGDLLANKVEIRTSSKSFYISEGAYRVAATETILTLTSGNLSVNTTIIRSKGHEKP